MLSVVEIHYAGWRKLFSVLNGRKCCLYHLWRVNNAGKLLEIHAFLKDAKTSVYLILTVMCIFTSELALYLCFFFIARHTNRDICTTIFSVKLSIFRQNCRDANTCVHDCMNQFRLKRSNGNNSAGKSMCGVVCKGPLK